ncbi:hypothetical protein RJT34_00090 [Clitoria ternatea]|uniref:Uncharacterized protein n=1 Tax=Clitoria ternatea TaxID=43366 RepID=A0AAN9KHJ1_CLITE
MGSRSAERAGSARRRGHLKTRQSSLGRGSRSQCITKYLQVIGSLINVFTSWPQIPYKALLPCGLEKLGDQKRVKDWPLVLSDMMKPWISSKMIPAKLMLLWAMINLKKVQASM